MSSASTTPFPGIKRCLSNGAARKRGRPPITSLKAPVFVAVFEGRASASGRLGVAAWNSASKDFYLFNMVDSTYSSLLTLLQELGPKEVLIDESTTTALQDAVGSACAEAEAAVFILDKKYFAGGSEAYGKLSSQKSKLADPHLKAECLSAFSALVQYSEHSRKAVFAPSSCTISIHERSLSIECPLCQKDGEKTVMSSLMAMQEHFFHYHWQVHGYACHFCGTMFPTKDDLENGHSECQEWTAWRESRNQLDTTLRMKFARQLLCCSDCGWHAALSSKNEGKDGDETEMREQRIREEATMKGLHTFFMNHNNDRLLSMIVYFPADPRGKVDSITLSVTSMAGGDPLAPCAHCGPSVTFRDPSEANEHYTKEHKDKTLICEVCNARTTTEYLLKQHQMSHIHDNSSYFADYLSNTARVFPPPTNLSHAPRCGWKLGLNGERAVGGIIAELGKGFDLVDPLEDLRETKTRLIKERKRRGRYVNERGYTTATVEEESAMAKEVREKLLRDYGDCEFVAGLQNPVWLRDSEALMFREWMEYWESAEGRKKGGPPKKSLDVDLSSSLVLVPTVDVELQLNDLVNPINGFALNDNVYYCHECHSIHKGKQAHEHLESPGQQQQSNKCAEGTQGIETNPVLNDNMFQLYSFAAAPADFRLPCPHCPIWSCSITGLRVHMIVVHGIFAACTPIANEILSDSTSFKVDIRVASEKEKKKGTKRRRESEGTEEDRVKREKKENEGDAVLSSSTAVRRMPVSMRRKKTGERISMVDVKRMEEKAKKSADELMMKFEQEPMVIDKFDDDIVILKARCDKNKTGTRFPVQSRGKTMMEDENHPLFHEFAPAEEDEDLCIVAEVENPGSSIDPATVQQREKKFACPKCSDKFITQASLTTHLENSHVRDAGQSTIMEELGIPVGTRLWICRSCCYAFSSEQMKSEHDAQHGTQPLNCDCCSGAAMNELALKEHLDRVARREVEYICGECKLSFDSDAGLHEHNRDVHSVALFYFCKGCFMGTTNGVTTYQHYIRDCPKAAFRPALDSTEDYLKWIGVVPATLLHFQPCNLVAAKRRLEEHPTGFIRPSVCNHRSLLVADSRQITCDECKCLQHIHTYVAQKQANGHEWDPMVRDSRSLDVPPPPPFSTLKPAFDRAVREEDRKQLVAKMALRAQQAHLRRVSTPNAFGIVMGTPATGVARVPSVVASGSRLGAAAPSSSSPINSSQQVLQRMDDRLTAANQQKSLQRTTTMSPAEKSSQLITPARSNTLGGSMVHAVNGRPLPALPSAGSTQGGMVGNNLASPTTGGRAVPNVPTQRTVSVTRRGGGTAMRGQGNQLITPARAETMAASGAIYQMANSFNAPTMKSGSAVSQLSASRKNTGEGAGTPDKTMARARENAAASATITRSRSTARPSLALSRTQSQGSTASAAKKPMPPPSLDH